MNSELSNQLAAIFLYGPPGVGKTTLGRRLSAALELPFFDLDEIIATQAGATISEIFSREGEPGFRSREEQALRGLLTSLRETTPGSADGACLRRPAVIALGGGALLAPANRELVESSGPVLLLNARITTLLERLGGPGPGQPGGEAAMRPLLSGGQALTERLPALLAARSEHYGSFTLQLWVDGQPIGPDDFEPSGNDGQVTSPAFGSLVTQMQIQLGFFRIRGMGRGYDVRVQPGGLDRAGQSLSALGLKGPVALVTDENVASRYAMRVTAALEHAGYRTEAVIIPPGEQFKTIETVSRLWKAFTDLGLERSSTVLALGGGVVGDLAGFTASTYLRGVRWVTLPTTLLAMIDASLGGKTGADLPQGKNLIGAFHPPSLVMADPEVLASLPGPELISGLAEALKHGIIGDEQLFQELKQPSAAGWLSTPGSAMARLVQRAIAIKVDVVNADPYESGFRAALNLGHTLGHAIERVTHYRWRHGEAVAAGLVFSARLSERLGFAQPGLANEIESAAAGLGLPVRIPAELAPVELLAAMQVDKKRQGGRVRFVLPRRIGQVQTGIDVDDVILLEELERFRSTAS